VTRPASAVAGLVGALYLAGFAHGLEPAAVGSSIQCSVSPIILKEPAYMVVDAVVRGDRLLLPDYTNGLREIDLETGIDASREIGRWINYYNEDRPHSAFDDETPMEVYTKLLAA